MTRADFYDWMISQDCKIEPLPEDSHGNVIKIKSPRSDSHVFYNTPIDERPVKCYSVCNMCHQLYIDVPDECKEYEKIATIIKEKHYPTSKKNRY